ncbi:hypothetical protein [Actinomadura sp. NPDC049753]|uniref:hypothetical protein n=1 Tax=Actinomadura sp. NPDC049753 TaxID=3154739 RepID=UPI0034262410
MLQRYTGAHGVVAGRYLAARGDGQRLIPAASVTQAALETRLLFACGRFDYGRRDESFSKREGAGGPLPPLGLNYVLGERDALQVSVHPRLLPQFIDQVLPRIEADGSEVTGIPGLRAHVRDRFVSLRRLGEAGRIVVRVSGKRWERATKYALSGIDSRNVAWLAKPDSWHSAEIEFSARYGHHCDYGRDGNAFLSDVLRRVNVLSGDGTSASYWDLWSSRRGCVELEWRGGPFHRRVLDLLLDPQFGLDAELQEPARVCRCDDSDPTRYNECYSMELIGAGGVDLNLRRQRPYGLDVQAVMARYG